MTIDLHTHGKLAGKLPYSREYTSWLFGEATAAGLDAICLTEHFNTGGFRQLYDSFYDGDFIRDGDSFLCPGLRIFTGMEVDIAEGGHVLVIGALEDVFALYDRLEDHRDKESYLPAAELLPLLGEYPVFVIAAHPFREGGHIPELPDEVLSGFDFIELNGKDVAGHREDIEERTYSLAGRLHLPVAAGSDTHQALQYGCICNRLPEECSTVAKLRELLLEGAPVISDTCEEQVKAAGMLKRALKEIDALGGDYTVALFEKKEVVTMS